MARTPRTVLVGPAGYQAVCPVPRDRIGFWEGLSLTVRGRLDAARNRTVSDGDHTHSMHRLLHSFRMGETKTVQSIDVALSTVDRELAPLEAVLGAPEAAPPTIPGHAELAALPESARAEWAERVRDAHRAQNRYAATAAERSKAVKDAPVLLSIRAALLVEGDDVRRRWAEAYAARAARYTRARSGRGGAAIAAVPAIPGFVRSADPTGERRG